MNKNTLESDVVWLNECFLMCLILRQVGIYPSMYEKVCFSKILLKWAYRCGRHALLDKGSDAFPCL